MTHTETLDQLAEKFCDINQLYNEDIEIDCTNYSIYVLFKKQFLKIRNIDPKSLMKVETLDITNEHAIIYTEIGWTYCEDVEKIIFAEEIFNQLME